MVNASPYNIILYSHFAALKYFPEERDFKFFAKGKPNVVVVPRRKMSWILLRKLTV